MDFIYKNKTYWIMDNESISELLKRLVLIDLPLSAWKDLLLLRYLVVSPNDLYKILEAKIKHYDTSLEVNSFLIGESPFWLDKATRVGLMHLANCSSEDLLLVLGDQVLTIPVDIAKAFLAQLEVYAGLCYLQTQKHLLAIKDLKTIEDMINYDYTKGYPEKITFNAWG